MYSWIFISSHSGIHGGVSALHTDEYYFCNEYVNILHDCILLYGAFIHFLRSMCSVIAVPLVPVTYFLRYIECKCDSWSIYVALHGVPRCTNVFKTPKAKYLLYNIMQSTLSQIPTDLNM